MVVDSTSSTTQSARERVPEREREKRVFEEEEEEKEVK